MSVERRSLGVVLVALGTPRARRDIRMCGFSSTASLDEVCRTLAATGMYSEESLRIDALRALGRVVERRFTEPANAAKWLALLHRRLGVWAAVSCAREVLHLVPKEEIRPRSAVDTAEAWVIGEAVASQATDAANAAADAAAAGTHGAVRTAIDAATDASYAARAVSDADAAGYVYDSARAAGVAATAKNVWYADRKVVLRHFVGVIAERLELFPAWNGDPAQDLWPMPPRSKR